MSHQAQSVPENPPNHNTNYTPRDKTELLDTHPSHQVHGGTEKTQPGTDIEKTRRDDTTEKPMAVGELLPFSWTEKSDSD